MEAEFNAIKQKLKNYIEGKKMDWIMFERNCEFKFVKAAHMNV